MTTETIIDNGYADRLRRGHIVSTGDRGDRDTEPEYLLNELL
jgi:hypothetical protein